MTNNEVLQLLKDFNAVSGMSVSIFSADLKEKFCYLKEPCTTGDKSKCEVERSGAFLKAKKTGKAVVFECHRGLWCAISPIMRNDALAGYLLLGQVLVDDASKCESYLNIMKTLCDYIAKNNLVSSDKTDLASETMEYINEHYFEDLSLTSLCERMKCSKSTLMKAFREKYGKSIGDAIKEVRLENATRLLIEDDASVKSIAIACGFYDQNYFTKVFKSAHGISPTQYRTKK